MIATIVVVWTVLLCDVLGEEANLIDVHEHFEVKGNASGGYGPRIHYGQVAKENQFPFMVFLQNKMGACGASYIRPKWVLTAAHCIVPNDTAVEIKDLIAISGQASMESVFSSTSIAQLPKEIQIRKSKSLHPHPNFEVASSSGEQYFNNDIALIELEEEFDPPVGFGQLAKERSKVLHNCTIVGWGLNEQGTFDGKLRYATGFTFHAPENGCKINDPNLLAMCYKTEKSRADFGDSGGPAICGGLISGICSCGDEKEGYYTDVARLNQWITDTIDGAPTSRKTSAILVLLMAVTMTLTTM